MKKLKKLFAISLSLITMLSVPTFAQNNSSNQYETSHTYSNFPFSNGTSFNTSISLSKTQPYGKAHFYNSSPYNVVLDVVGEKSVTIKPYTSGYVIWEKSAIKNNYNVTVRSKGGTLNGTFSLAKSE
ncbi:MAG: hypothetical protein K2F59_02240, partial [Eubacteriales bacterium]|nr:hypothetical protein [Eubacteriales bacterium]